MMTSFEPGAFSWISFAIATGVPGSCSPTITRIGQRISFSRGVAWIFGSAALQHVARVLEETKRAEDTAARWGGDEFAVLMAGAGRDAVRRQSEAIRERLQREPVRADGGERSVSVTIGAATAEAGEPSDLFAAADRALYEGKKLAKTAG